MGRPKGSKNKKPYPKKQFCKRGHNIIVVGRDKFGNCEQCVLDRNRVDPTKDSRLKQFCVHGHDTYIWGRNKKGTCKICAKDIKKRTMKALNSGERIRVSKKQFCVNNHDTFICGRTKRGLCNECEDIRDKEYYMKNQDKIKTKQTRYYKVNREKELKINRDLPNSNFYKNRNAKLLRNFKITLEDYNKMFDEQNGKCILCSRLQVDFKRDFGVDHDHSCCPGSKSCGKCVRGLLCDPCNRALGLFRDDLKTLKNAIKYLERN